MGITGSIPAAATGVETYTAGESIPAHSVVCLSETEEKVYMAQATSWSRMPAIGTTKHAANAGNTVEVYYSGTIRNVARTENFGYDVAIYVSEIAGKVTRIPIETVGAIYQEIGRAKNSSDVVLNMQEPIEIGA